MAGRIIKWVDGVWHAVGLDFQEKRACNRAFLRPVGLSTGEAGDEVDDGGFSLLAGAIERGELVVVERGKIRARFYKHVNHFDLAEERGRMQRRV